MKICMIGLGSIGRRHVKNIVKVLQDAGETVTIDALRSSRSTIAEDIVPYIGSQYYQVEDMPDDYDAIFITNPTSEHYSTIAAVSSKTKHMFIEKPVFNNPNENIEELHLRENGIYYVACPMRHNLLMQKAKEIIGQRKIYSVQAICSSYLPEWRPGTDYRKNYSARRDLGGGVTLDLIHEWDYLIDLFGFPKEIKSFSGEYSDLEMDVEDLSVYIARYDDKLLEVHLDYFGRKTQRKLVLFSTDDVIEIDFLSNEIRYSGDCEKIIKIDNTDIYLNEMRYFFELIQYRRKNINSIQHAIEILRVALSEYMVFRNKKIRSIQV